MKKAFITGITGQDGYYLAKFLLEKNYQVFGTIRRASSFNTSRIDSLIAEYGPNEMLKLFYSDLLDPSSLSSLVNSTEPDELYNLAAQSHVAVSFKNPMYSIQSGTIGPVSLLESIKNSKKEIKFYQASSSEMFGGIDDNILNENSEFIPKSPYAAAKLFAYNMTKIYRESYNLHAVNGILFNHESPVRGETFVTRKITRAVGRIYYGIQSKLTLGNLEASRDWGYAGDYVEGMWKMLNYKNPDDWVLATGESHSVREFAKKAFEVVNLNYEDFVISSDKYYRPNEVNYLLGNPSKAVEKLNWKPKTSFDQLVNLMVESDLKLAEREKVLIEKDLMKPTWEHSSY